MSDAAIQHKRQEEFFETSYKISLFLDYPSRSLSQEMLYRKKMYFDESEILYFLDSMIGALAFLQSKGQAYLMLKLDKVQLVTLYNGALGLKVSSPLQNNDEITLKDVLEDSSLFEQLPYPSPEQLLMLRSKKLETYNEVKSTVFTLGMYSGQLILEMCSVRKSSLIYKDLSIDEHLLKDHLQKVNDRYGSEISIFINGMLEPDPRLRCDFLDFDDTLTKSPLFAGRRISQVWNMEDYQYCHGDSKKVHFSTKQHSLAHPEINSQLSNQSMAKNDGKGSYMSIKQVISKNSKESRSSSALNQRRDSYSPQMGKKTLFKKYDTEQASRGGSKRFIGQDGFSIESQANGLTYEGHLVGGKKEGEGKLLRDDNEVIYEGYFKDNAYHHTGTLKNQDMAQLTEPFNYENLNNIGNYWARYEGDFNLGQRHGYGQLVLSNAERYTGQFFENMAHGTGVYFTMRGEQIKGEWANGLLVHRMRL